MTAQRARNSASREALYGEAPGIVSGSTLSTVAPPSPTRSTSSKNPNAPSTPTKQRIRQTSGLSSAGLGSPGAGEVENEGSFRFSGISEEEADSIRRDWARTLGISLPIGLSEGATLDEEKGMSDEDFATFIHTSLGPPGRMQDLAT